MDPDSQSHHLEIMRKPERFDYDKDTRCFYKHDTVADAYHQEFNNARGLNGFRFRYIAEKERAAVRQLLRGLSASHVIDVPAGTGKMAPIFADFGCAVLACDVSENMLNVARRTYSEAGLDGALFRVVNLETATTSIEENYDVTVCIRLMHRVPDDIKQLMLSQIAKLTPHAIVSFGIDSNYQRARYALRRRVFRTQDMGLETRPSRRRIEALLRNNFEIVEDIPVAAGISAQRAYLLRSKVA